MTGSKILVIGASSMLGSMLVRRARDVGHEPICISRDTGPFDARSSKAIDILSQECPDLIVNCVAVNRIQESEGSRCEDAMLVNAWFPRLLSKFAEQNKFRLLHISTDGVFRGRTTPYLETDEPDTDELYGVTKSLGEHKGRHTINIRCSIVGPEVKNRGHLLNWLLNHPDGETVQGFTNHAWHGVTTLQLADYCLKFVNDGMFEKVRKASHLLHYAPNVPISKFELLEAINVVYNRKLKIRRVESPTSRMRILDSKFCRSAEFNCSSERIENALAVMARY